MQYETGGLWDEFWRSTKMKTTFVRSVKLLIGEKRSSFTSRILEQPISNLVLLVDAENDM